MKEYHKIKGIYRFDEKTHLPIQQIDEYFLPLAKNEWIFTEKIDGTNVRVMRDGHRPMFGGRTDNAQLPTKLYNHLESKFIEPIFEQHWGSTPVVLYGEGYGGKIQAGGLYNDTEGFILFDVEINNIFLKREDVEEIATYFDIPCVPVITQGSLYEGIEYMSNVKNNGKHICKGQIEGLVGTPVGGFLDRLGNRVIVKIKTEHFKTEKTR